MLPVTIAPLVSAPHRKRPLLGCPRGSSYNALYGEATPERGTIFRLQVYEREGISLVEVYERV